MSLIRPAISSPVEKEALEVTDKIINDPLHGVIVICVIFLAILVLAAGMYMFIRLRQFSKSSNSNYASYKDIDIVHKRIDKIEKELTDEIKELRGEVKENRHILGELNTKTSFIYGKLNGKV